MTDSYATQLAAFFYTNLSVGDRPLASSALALARQQLERERDKARERGEHAPAEYATASLFCFGPEWPIFDRSLDFVRPVKRERKALAGVVPLLSVGELIGRRAEVRRVMRVLTDDRRSLEALGRKAGCQILGMGGVGKSSIAGRVMERLSEAGWTCVSVAGKWTLARWR